VTLFETMMRRFARLVTRAVVARPVAWSLFRPMFRRQWDRIAPSWDQSRLPDSYAPYRNALELLPKPPSRALDVGTGTGGGAFSIAAHFPAAEVVGVDFSKAMVAHASAKITPQLSGRVSFRQADAASLPFSDGTFDLVAHSNMIPFFDEIARVLRAGGYALFAFSSGTQTPIFVPFDRLKTELQRRGFSDFTQCSAGRGMALVARKRGGD
jgi:ubiquinone/menaquinone biosynthesis C-methylase UbiE